MTPTTIFRIALSSGQRVAAPGIREVHRIESRQQLPDGSLSGAGHGRTLDRAVARAALHALAPAAAAPAGRAALAREEERITELLDPGDVAAISALPHSDVRPLPGVAHFIATVASYIARERETIVRELARSAFSGVPRVTASALIIAAGDRSTFAETLARRTLPLGAENASAANAFVDGLAACANSIRAQGATATELIATIASRFDLGTSERGAIALDIARAEAAAIDAVARATKRTWQPRDLERAIRERMNEALSGTHVAPVHVPEPFAPLSPETPHDVRRNQSRFSASSLNTYAECERKWYYRYVCNAVEDPGGSASFYGTAFHSALEAFHTTYTRLGDTPVEELERELDMQICTAFASYRTTFETPIEFELQRRRARLTAKPYLAWFVKRSRAAPFEVVGNETTAEIQLDGYDFIGYIDRLDRDDRTGAITVIDYKTGNIAGATEYRKNIAAFVQFQLPFYYWARTEAGDRVTGLALIPLKVATLEVRPVELEVVPVAGPLGRFDDPRGTIGIDELRLARTKMVEYARRLRDEPIERFAVARDPDACTYCVYVNACRERPLGDPERFGR